MTDQPQKPKRGIFRKLKDAAVAVESAVVNIAMSGKGGND